MIVFLLKVLFGLGCLGIGWGMLKWAGAGFRAIRRRDEFLYRFLLAFQGALRLVWGVCLVSAAVAVWQSWLLAFALVMGIPLSVGAGAAGLRYALRRRRGF